ncbi:MAG: Crp/Fnr family transcriptional regulator [Gallionellaceae bacterium]
MEVHLSDKHSPRQNRLLDALPADVYELLYRHLELVKMPLGEVLYESGEDLHYVYFPTNCIVSLLYILENGASAEIAMIGNEGIVGVALFMGGKTMPNRAVVQSAGYAFRLHALLVQQKFGQIELLLRLLLRYIQARIIQTAQAAVCNQHHSVDQRLCRWLLQSIDRLPGNELIVTQELISNMLGVRREGITEAAGKLQQAGLIAYRRGHITVLNRPGLEEQVCECYQVVKSEFDRLLPLVVTR